MKRGVPMEELILFLFAVAFLNLFYSIVNERKLSTILSRLDQAEEKKNETPQPSTPSSPETTEE